MSSSRGSSLERAESRGQSALERQGRSEGKVQKQRCVCLLREFGRHSEDISEKEAARDGYSSGLRKKESARTSERERDVRRSLASSGAGGRVMITENGSL